VSQRKLIRQALKALLIAQATRAGARVFTNRAEALAHKRGAGKLPAIVIYSRHEPAENYNEAPRTYKREPLIAVEFVLSGAAATANDDELDDFIEEAEPAILNNPTLDGVAERMELVETEIGMASDGSELIGAGRVTFQYSYYTRVDETGPDPPGITAFITAAVDWEFDPIDPAPEAQDTINPPQP
jgi:hypothetical protein